MDKYCPRKVANRMWIADDSCPVYIYAEAHKCLVSGWWVGFGVQ
jgi:hypothetical protein